MDLPAADQKYLLSSKDLLLADPSFLDGFFA